MPSSQAKLDDAIVASILAQEAAQSDEAASRPSAPLLTVQDIVNLYESTEKELLSTCKCSINIESYRDKRDQLHRPSRGISYNPPEHSREGISLTEMTTAQPWRSVHTPILMECAPLLKMLPALALETQSKHNARIARLATEHTISTTIEANALKSSSSSPVPSKPVLEGTLEGEEGTIVEPGRVSPFSNPEPVVEDLLQLAGLGLSAQSTQDGYGEVQKKRGRPKSKATQESQAKEESPL